MAKYKPYDYRQNVMVAVILDDQLQPGTLEHTIHYVVENRLDLTSFDAQYRNTHNGRSAYNPKVLLKIVLLGYARGLNTSRRLERACRENVVFMAMSCGQSPDHSTIADFVSGMGEERIASLFSQVLLVCDQEGLLGGTHFSLDGLKLPSNASKEWSGTKADLLKKQRKLEALVHQAVQTHKAHDAGSGAEDVGAERRLERLRRKAERIERFLAENKPRLGRRGKEVQSNITDNESAKMRGAHGVIQGYNANAMVESKRQVVVLSLIHI